MFVTVGILRSNKNLPISLPRLPATFTPTEALTPHPPYVGARLERTLATSPAPTEAARTLRRSNARRAVPSGAGNSGCTRCQWVSAIIAMCHSEQRVRAGFGLASWVITVTTWAGAKCYWVCRYRSARQASTEGPGDRSAPSRGSLFVACSDTSCHSGRYLLLLRAGPSLKQCFPRQLWAPILYPCEFCSTVQAHHLIGRL